MKTVRNNSELHEYHYSAIEFNFIVVTVIEFPNFLNLNTDFIL